jgi:hypothetical protein
MLEELPDELPPRKQVDHAIEMMPGVAPPAKAPYRMNHEELKEFKVQLEELLAKGYIKPSKSPYGAPVLMVVITLVSTLVHQLWHLPLTLHP